MGDHTEQLKTYTFTCLKHLPTQTHLWKWNAYPGSTKPQSALKNILQCVKKQNKRKDIWLVFSESAAFVGPKVHRSRTRERKRKTTWIPGRPLLKERKQLTTLYSLHAALKVVSVCVCWEICSTSLEAMPAAPAAVGFPPIGLLFIAIPWPFSPREKEKC